MLTSKNLDDASGRAGPRAVGIWDFRRFRRAGAASLWWVCRRRAWHSNTTVYPFVFVASSVGRLPTISARFESILGETTVRSITICCYYHLFDELEQFQLELPLHTTCGGVKYCTLLPLSYAICARLVRFVESGVVQRVILTYLPYITLYTPSYHC